MSTYQASINKSEAVKEKSIFETWRPSLKAAFGGVFFVKIEAPLLATSSGTNNN
jgi:hypothetical protein